MSKIAALAFAFPLRLYLLFPVWADPLNPPGGAASSESADRFVRLDANPPCIIVALGETVTLVSSEQSFTWLFDTSGVDGFPLSRIAGAGFAGGAVKERQPGVGPDSSMNRASIAGARPYCNRSLEDCTGCVHNAVIALRLR